MKQPNWSPEEVAVLEGNRTLTNTQLHKLLPHRTLAAVVGARKARGLGRTADTKRRFWTEEHFAFMRANTHMKDAEMARALGVRLGSLSQARKSADIRKVYRCVRCDVVLGAQGKWCSKHNTAARRWTQYASKAAARSLEYSLTHDDLHDLLEKPCTYCGGEGGGIDRIDSDKGYVLGNAAPCCWRCNAMKNDLPLSDWIAHMKQVIGHTEATK